MNKTTYLTYHNKMEKIILGIKDNTFDLVCTDPPFGVRKEGWDNKDHFVANLNFWLYQCMRVSKSTVIWFCASRMLPYIMKAIDPDFFHRLHTWEKPEGTQFAGASHNNIWYSIEPILIFSKNKELTISYGKDMPFNYDSFKYRTVPFKNYGHPTSKPLPLICKLLGHYSPLYGSVLDPFAGSFTTTVAGIKTYRKTVCIEQSPLPGMPIDEETNPDYYGRGMERIAQCESEPAFWDEEAKEILEDKQISMFNEETEEIKEAI